MVAPVRTFAAIIPAPTARDVLALAASSAALDLDQHPGVFLPGVALVVAHGQIVRTVEALSLSVAD